MVEVNRGRKYQRRLRENLRAQALLKRDFPTGSLWMTLGLWREAIGQRPFIQVSPLDFRVNPWLHDQGPAIHEWLDKRKLLWCLTPLADDVVAIRFKNTDDAILFKLTFAQ